MFKEGIFDDPLLVLSSWNALDSDPCNWVGVSCSGDQVTKLIFFFPLILEAPIDDFQESHETVFDIPAIPTNHHRSFDQSTSPPSYIETSSQMVEDNGKSLDSHSTLSESLEYETKEAEDNPNLKGCTDAHSEDGLSSMHTAQQKLDTLATTKTFVGTEILDGKAVNVVDGMKMYEELFDDSGVRKMVSLINDLKVAGRRGQFQGKSPTILNGSFSSKANATATYANYLL
ncbi:hypothetical protein L6452_19775 [Arctium lappa]|uniref:Uncharacterized protein n=1 Tax=Arctium lappa TaxID=4217 RepID=A0ACB9BAB3_ARCLA|nr:hypothetical protein L6452_19775 [Arctium lappa]